MAYLGAHPSLKAVTVCRVQTEVLLTTATIDS